MTKSAVRSHKSAIKGGQLTARKQHNKTDRHSYPSRDVTTSVTRNEEDPQVFPRWTPVIVFALTLVLRTRHVFNPSNWWMVHPDEVFQSLEVAHIEVYGYGFRTSEFSPSETATSDVTGYRQMELDAGKYALRSPLFPFYYVFVSWAVSLVRQIDINPYLLWRVSHVMITSLLPLAVSRYVSMLYRSTDTAAVAAILVASSAHLNVFGTRCLIQPFMAPITFFALSMLTSCVTSDKIPNERKEFIDSPASLKTKKTLSCETQDEIVSEGSAKTKNTLKEDAQKTVNRNQTQNLNGTGTGAVNQRLKQKSGSAADIKDQYSAVAHQSKTTNYAQVSIATFLFTLTTYIRPDVLFTYIINIVTFPNLRLFLCSTNLPAVVLSVTGALAVGIGTDFKYYGYGESSLINWVRFCVNINTSELILSHISFWLYIDKFFRNDPVILALTVFALFMLIVTRWKYHNSKKLTENETSEDSLNMLEKDNYSIRSCLICFANFICYSFLGYKEIRYFHDTIIMFFIFSAGMLVNLKYIFKSRTVSVNSIRLILTVSVISQWRSFPDPVNNQEWVFRETKSVHEVNSCVKFISEQNDVSGVFYNANFYMTGGTSLLHHNVVIMSLTDSGFYEFGPRTWRNYTRGQKTLIPSISSNHNKAPYVKSIREFTRATNYVSAENGQGVMRIIIRNTLYNYLLLRQDRRFVDFGFKEVFATKNFRVLKRSLDAASKYRLNRMLERITVGNNTTTLLHEGFVLLNMNQFHEASTRFYQAIHLNERLVEAYPPLAVCYSNLGLEPASKAVYGKCLSLFNDDVCSTSRMSTTGLHL